MWHRYWTYAIQGILHGIICWCASFIYFIYYQIVQKVQKIEQNNNKRIKKIAAYAQKLINCQKLYNVTNFISIK